VLGPGAFLPTTKRDLEDRGIDQLDIIIVTGDAYVDHPAFGAALVGRHLQSLGLTVGIIAMPDVKDPRAFTKLDAPRYFFAVTAGNVDSMLSLFTAQKKIRSDDPYVPGGLAGVRPQRATIAYCNAIRRVFKDVPIVIGGVEASLRRIVHYDYWSDVIRQPIILDAKADMLIYGMAEKPLEMIARELKSGKKIDDLGDIPGTVIPLGKRRREEAMAHDPGIVRLPSFEETKLSKSVFSEMTKVFYENLSSAMIQESGTLAIKINPPAPALTQKEFDRVYSLPFTYQPHPLYKEQIPAFEQIKDSITVVRGCLGGCNFCGLGVHQGKTIQSRSPESIEREITRRCADPRWKGIVSDLGGPTANMYGLYCKRGASHKECKRRSCLAPRPCEFLFTSQSDFAELVRKVASMKKVKHVSINSGVRMDLALLWPEIIEVLAKHAVGGLLSVAPEHISPKVLKLMNKPEKTDWEEFEELFTLASKRAGKQQFLSPYLIAGHPGSSETDAQKLADYLKQKHLRVRQVQEFIPFPMTVSASIYYTGEDPFTKEKVQVSYKLSDKRREKETIMWWENK
jgi:uncharacterized radical SAM protein YgiQ